MSTTTTNLGLIKPATTDSVNISDFNTNSDTLDSAVNNLRGDVGIVENGNTATHAISSGQYVIWKGNLYTATTNIANGATLSGSNLSSVSGGGLNALNSNLANKSKIKTVDINITNNYYGQVNNLSGNIVSVNNFISGIVMDTNSIVAIFYTYSNIVYVQLREYVTWNLAPISDYKVRIRYFE